MASKKGVSPDKRVTSERRAAEHETELDAPAETQQAKATEAVVEMPTYSIVGIGASAGGLEAFEHFFRAVPADSGLAFVLVPHLDPSHASILSEILQRCSAIPVQEAKDQMPVLLNHAYIIPPNRDMSIFHGVLQLSVPETPHAQRMPIDSFLRSLAEDQGEKAIGVILSGTGSDGTLGLRAILGAGGISLVQEPDSARYDGMPSSAIRSGYASHVMSPDKMYAAIRDGARSLFRRQDDAAGTAVVEHDGINRILLLLRSATGHDFSQYKKSTINRRIERRMVQHNLDNPDIYARYLREHPAEIRILFKELLINVTSFFRDPEAFAVLKSELLPELLANKPDGYTFRVWVAGCATGEEAYSIAILLREYLDETRESRQTEFNFQIYSTDLDDEAIAVARAGVYPLNISQDLTPERLRHFFIKEGAGYRVKKDIREMVVFAVQNVIKDPPFTRLDLLSCRNLMIYLEAELQNRLLPILHYALKPGGVLFLSPSESIGNHSALFSVLNRKWKLYRATPSVTFARSAPAAALAWSNGAIGNVAPGVLKKNIATNFAELTRRVLLQSYAPASVVADRNGSILFIHGETGKYLRPAPGQASLNLVDMAREGLQLELRSALLQATTQNTPTLNREISVKTNGSFQNIYLSVRSLPDPDAGQGLLLVSFQDVPAHLAAEKKAHPKRSTGAVETHRIDELQHELSYTKENLHATIEEQQASNEELKSANEELQSTNEELQSTNEEMETSKEELQSLNEELVTVNSELQAKIELLADMQNDMKNLLDNVNVGTIFLDHNLAIRRYTREAANVYRLVSTDVGRLLADIKADLLGDDLLPDVHAVMNTLQPVEREIQTVTGLWFLLRIQPYRTLDNLIDGVVLTFADISKRVAAENEMRAQREFAEAIIDTLREPLLVLNEAAKVISVGRAFCRTFQVEPTAVIGRTLFELGNGQWNIPALHELLENTLRQGESFDDFLVEHDFPRMGQRKMLLNARRIDGPPGAAPLVLLAMEAARE